MSDNTPSHQFGSNYSSMLSFWASLNQREKITWMLALISLLADAIAIIQTISIISSPNISVGTVFNSSFAFGIWFLASFTYVSLLHSYWEKAKESEALDDLFSRWFFKDVILDFKQPKLLFPSIALIVTLFLIASATDPSGFFVTMLIIITVIGVAFLFAIKSEFSKNSSELLTPLFKRQVEQEWEFWEDRIESEFNRKVVLTARDFKDIAITRGLDSNNFKYILATYANKHSDSVRFGNVFDREKMVKTKYSFEAIIIYDALVHMETLDQNKYWVGS